MKFTRRKMECLVTSKWFFNFLWFIWWKFIQIKTYLCQIWRQIDLQPKCFRCCKWWTSRCVTTWHHWTLINHNLNIVVNIVVIKQNFHLKVWQQLSWLDHEAQQDYACNNNIDCIVHTKLRKVTLNWITFIIHRNCRIQNQFYTWLWVAYCNLKKKKTKNIDYTWGSTNIHLNF
jgi:hypothetical protein